jgi:hypothetical protein
MRMTRVCSITLQLVAVPAGFVVVSYGTMVSMLAAAMPQDEPFASPTKILLLSMFVVLVFSGGYLFTGFLGAFIATSRTLRMVGALLLSMQLILIAAFFYATGWWAVCGPLCMFSMLLLTSFIWPLWGGDEPVNRSDGTPDAATESVAGR